MKSFITRSPRTQIMPNNATKADISNILSKPMPILDEHPFLLLVVAAVVDTTVGNVMVVAVDGKAEYEMVLESTTRPLEAALMTSPFESVIGALPTVAIAPPISTIPFTD